MFNAKALFLLLLSIGVGTGAAFYAKNWLQAQQGNVAQSADNTTDVLVAAREIPYGQVIEESHLRVVAWPKEALPEGIYTAKEDVVGKIINQTALAGDLMLQARVVEKLEGSRLSALIAPNKRAITVRVDDVNGVAGFLLPGNRVDVLATRLVDRRATTKTLLQDIKVLAIDQKASPDKDDPVVVRAVTLEADLEQAEKLTGATAEGKIQLVLRNPDDRAVVREEVPVARETTRVAPRDTRQDITIIRGTSVNQSKVRL